MSIFYKILFIISTLFTLIFASGGCILVQSEDINVTWKAYKTLGKVGVEGKFTSVKYLPAAKEGKNFKELFVGSKIYIDTTKIDTNNQIRDDMLVRMFFKKLKSTVAEARVVSMKANKHLKGEPYTGIINIMLTLNKKTLTLPMYYRYEKEKFTAEGTLDLFDFKARDALTTINKSCYDLHEGKTWNDVKIAFTTTIKATLCKADIKK